MLINCTNALRTICSKRDTKGHLTSLLQEIGKNYIRAEGRKSSQMVNVGLFSHQSCHIPPVNTKWPQNGQQMMVLDYIKSHTC
jgi:hypothetical protein